ncbi:MAG: RIP metalloprotease RseP [Flavobacteriales bacterium]|nr:RIP metalloprotease RseP [Flavobacteriales bacterium]
MEDILIKGSQFLLSLSILVILHEFGHFIPAKLFKTRVEKFYLFFDWKFSLFKFNMRGTEYGIGWIPLGGYVKISGMIDESMDTDQMKTPPQPWEFRSKPAWQRLIIMLGGVTVNFLLAMVIYSAVLFVWGEKYLPNENLTGGIWVRDSLAMDMGFRNGDKIVDINGKRIERFSEIMPEMIYGGSVKVLRESGEEEFIDIPKDFIEQLVDKESRLLFIYRMPFLVSELPAESHNLNSGLQTKDIIVGINGKEVLYWDQYEKELAEVAGQRVELNVRRGDEKLVVQADVNEHGKIGVGFAGTSLIDLDKLGFYKLETNKFGLLESIPAGIGLAYDRFSSYLRQLKLIFNPSTGAYKGVGGFAAIGNLFPAEWNWQIFWEMTAFLSIMLGVLNLLPIPALDGGHVMFTLYEIVSGRKPSDKFLEYAQMIGLVLLLSLFVFANGNDLFKAFK